VATIRYWFWIIQGPINNLNGRKKNVGVDKGKLKNVAIVQTETHKYASIPCFLSQKNHPLETVSRELSATSYASPIHCEHI